MLDALVAYMLEFDYLPNEKLTPDGKLTEAASEAAHRGEEVFKRPFPQMDGKACATCHVPSANFLDRRAHDIGSGGGAEAERSDLTAYLEAVGDADEPWERFDERHTPFRLAFEELTTFASTLDTLIPARDAFHATLLIDTVAADLAADASAMSNLAAKPEVYELARTLDQVGAAIEAGEWQTAETPWSDFKALEAEIDERMF